MSCDVANKLPVRPIIEVLHNSVSIGLQGRSVTNLNGPMKPRDMKKASDCRT